MPFPLERVLPGDRAFYTYYEPPNAGRQSPEIELDTLHIEWDDHLLPEKKQCLEKVMRVFWNVLSVLIPIIGLVRLALYYATRKLLLPALSESPNRRNEDFQSFVDYSSFSLSFQEFLWGNELSAAKLPQYRAEEHFVYTPDGVKLSIKVFRCHSSESEGPVPTHLYFPGNGELANPRYLRGMMDYCVKNHLPGHFVFFDYRGVGDSGGNMELLQDLVVDGYTVARWAEEALQTPPDQIYFYGTSLGGAIATETKALNPAWTAPLISDRSFSTLSKEVRVLVADTVGCDWIGRLAAAIVRSQGHQLKPSKKIEQLQGKVIVLYHPQDDVIPEKAQMQYSLAASDSHCEKISLEEELLFLNPKNPVHFFHDDPWTENMKDQVGKIIFSA